MPERLPYRAIAEIRQSKEVCQTHAEAVRETTPLKYTIVCLSPVGSPWDPIVHTWKYTIGSQGDPTKCAQLIPSSKILIKWVPVLSQPRNEPAYIAVVHQLAMVQTLRR